MIPGKNEAFDLRNRKAVVADTSGTALTQEEVQDYVAPLFAHSNHINASVTYEDALNELHIDVTNAPSAGYTSQVKHEVKLGEAIAKGQAVYVSSADGTNMIVSKASNATDATSSKTMGLLETGGATNAKVNVITEGLLTGLDTSTATVGDPVWLGTSGNLIYGTANKPVAPAHLVYLGVVTRVNANNGEIFVHVVNGFELEELHNVLLDASPTDNEVLAYDSASTLWKNQTASEAGLATSTHVHGNVTNTGALATSVTATNPVKVVITDSGNVLGTLSTTNASATTFLRGDGTWVTPTAGTGTVTSVGLSLPSIFTVTNSPVTTAGTLTATLASQNQQLFLASPTSGSGTPTFRYISTSDFTQAASPAIGQALVAAPVTGGWSWASFLPTYGGSLTGGLTLAAGGTSVTPLRFTANTSAQQLQTGVMDYDGNAFFGTPKVNNTSRGRGLIPTQQIFIPNANTTIVTTSGSTGTFSGDVMGGKAIYLAASTTYEVDAVLYVQHTWTATATTNFTINLLYPTGSTALISGVGSYATSTSVSGTANQFALNSTTAVVISASPTSGNWYRVRLKGIIKTSTTAGDFSPTFGYTTSSGSTTATNTVGANSFIKVNPIAGVGADINIGGWA